MKITQQLLKEMIEEELGQILSESAMRAEVMDVVYSISDHLDENFGAVKGAIGGDIIASISRPGIDPIELKREKIRDGRKIQTILVPIQVIFPRS